MDFSIAGIGVGIRCAHDVRMTEPFLPFLKDASDGWILRVESVDDLPDCSGKAVFRSNVFDVFRTERGYRRCYKYWEDRNRYYADSMIDPAHKTIRIAFLKGNETSFSEVGSCLVHSGWENMLSYEKRFILHASCIRTDLGGILFCGPSGIGKSTQAGLWEQYEKAELINGDRPIVGLQNGEWTAFGSPYAGSSRCYRNDSCAIRAVVLLQQGNACSIRKLDRPEAFRRLYPLSIVCNWDGGCVERICDMLSQLLETVNVYEYCCTKDAHAVQFLKEKLREEETNGSSAAC